LNGTDYAVRIDWTDDGTAFATIGSFPADVQFGSFIFTTANLLQYQRMTRNRQTITGGLQFLDQPGGDGVGYQDYDLMGPNASVIQVEAKDPNSSTVVVLPTTAGGWPTYEVVTSSNGSPGGALRIHKTPVTYAQQAIWASYSSDPPLVNVRSRTFAQRLALVRTRTGEVVAEFPVGILPLPFGFGLTLTVGTVPLDGRITD
jgi:hypothetical protein